MQYHAKRLNSDVDKVSNGMLWRFGAFVVFNRKGVLHNNFIGEHILLVENIHITSSAKISLRLVDRVSTVLYNMDMRSIVAVTVHIPRVEDWIVVFGLWFGDSAVCVGVG